MSRKLKTLIIALGVLVLLAGGYYGSTILMKRKADTVQNPYTPSPRLGNLVPAQLVKMEFRDFVLEKTNGIWDISSLGGKSYSGGMELDQNQIESLTWSMASMYIDRTLDEAEDLSVYGLDKPSVRASATDSGGKKVVYLLGDYTPSMTAYYIMEEGDPRVHIVSGYSAENLSVSLDKFRVKELFPAFELQELARLRLESPRNKIEIFRKPSSVPVYLNTSFSLYFISSPYKLTRGVDSETLNNMVMPLSNLSIFNFVDDDPSSLEPYGLDKPVKVYLETETDSIEFLIGGRAGDDGYYAKLPDSRAVFTLGNMDPLVNVKPFSLLDKFALIVNIDNVDRLSVSGGERNLVAEFKGKGEDGVYYLNGKRAEEKPFKTWYQAVIGLLFDAEHPSPPEAVESSGTGEITVEYELNTPPFGRASLTLIPYNRDFYALRQEGAIEFLISRNQARNMFTSADAVVFAE